MSLLVDHRSPLKVQITHACRSTLQKKLLWADCNGSQRLARPLMSGLNIIFCIDVRANKVEQSRELGLRFCSGVPCVTGSTPGSPVCRPKQSKTKKKKNSSSEYCLVLHFPFCFLIRVSRACRCRENLKRSCELRISANTRCLSALISC